MKSYTRKINAAFGAGLLAFLFLIPLAATAQNRVVRTESGQISGNALSNGLEVFKGIPFAAPPVGKLRWAPPQPAATWKGVRKAESFGSPCMQPQVPERIGPWTGAFLSQLQAGEDCLYLNIWTTAKPPSKLLPVMVWIYGGGFTSGAGSVEIYDGAALASQGVVVVNFNYRVGPFGFLAYPELTKESPHHSSGNYTLLDQIAALQWVRRNIRAFGGDPDEVTIFGQSAGAASVWALTQSPLAVGLFERAIVMSGPAVIPYPGINASNTLAAAEQEGEKFAKKLGATSLAQLRDLPAEKVMKASQQMRWGPIRDGWVLRAGWQPEHQVPMINGTVADDIGIGYYGTDPAPPETLKDLHKTLQQICGDELQACEKLYPASDDRQAASVREAALQDRVRVSLYRWAERQLRFSPHVYIYFFNRELPWPQHPEYAVFHSSELPYVFNNLRLLDRPWQPVDRRVADQISSYWANFAKAGSPDAKGLPMWPAFKVGNETIMQLAGEMKPIPLAAPARQKFWMDYLKKPLGF